MRKTGCISIQLEYVEQLCRRSGAISELDLLAAVEEKQARVSRAIKQNSSGLFRQPASRQVGKRLTVALSKAFSRLTFGSRPSNLVSLAAYVCAWPIVRCCGSCLRVSSALLDCDRDKVLREALHRLHA